MSPTPDSPTEDAIGREKVTAAGKALQELASIEIEPERPCSVEITHNAKGETTFKVKAYAVELEDAETKAQEAYARMGAWVRAGSGRGTLKP